MGGCCCCDRRCEERKGSDMMGGARDRHEGLQGRVEVVVRAEGILVELIDELQIYQLLETTSLEQQPISALKWV